MSVIDINSRTRYAGRGRPGASPVVGPDAGLVFGRAARTNVGDSFAGYPITARLGAELRDLNEAVRDADDEAPLGRPAGGAVSHVSAMLQKMRAASNEEHARSARPDSPQADFAAWHAQVDCARTAMMGSRADAMEAPIAPDALNGAQAWRPAGRSARHVSFVTTPAVGHPMRKDIALDALDSCAVASDLLGRQVIVNIQGVSFSCMITREVMDAVRSGRSLSSVMGSALQTAIRHYALLANGDVVDAVLDGSVLNIRYVGAATKPLLVSAFTGPCPAVDLWSMEVGDEGPALRVVAAPIDGVFAASSRSCIAVDRAPFVNDNAFDVVADDAAAPGATEVLDYSAASSESDKRSIIEKAAMAMIRKARQAEEPER